MFPNTSFLFSIFPANTIAMENSDFFFGIHIWNTIKLTFKIWWWCLSCWCLWWCYRWFDVFIFNMKFLCQRILFANDFFTCSTIRWCCLICFTIDAIFTMLRINWFAALKKNKIDEQKVSWSNKIMKMHNNRW